MSEGWITIEVVYDEISANLRKGILDQAGISCVIEGCIYRPRAVVPMYNEFKLNVPENQLEFAKKALDAYNDNDK